jgi:hypothetical protein
MMVGEFLFAVTMLVHAARNKRVRRFSRLRKESTFIGGRSRFQKVCDN